MRLHRLELTGFGPFHDLQSVDFDAFAADGIFLISGRTGAGKSSVLDGVSFALFGGVPRYDGADKRVRSDHCAPQDPTLVTVEFTASARRWRVSRSPEYERPKKSGIGTTTEPHRATLDEWVDGQWRGRAARPVDVANALDEILGVNQQQFLQVILLAQNRFAQFLHARSEERQKLLRRLFGTRTYEQYQSALDERRRESERARAESGANCDLVLREAARIAGDAGIPLEFDGLPPVDRVDELERTVQRARYRAETLVRERAAADLAHRAADSAHAALNAVREAQLARLRARQTLSLLDDETPVIATRRSEVERARHAESMRDALRRADAARAGAGRARTAVGEALEAWTAAFGEPTPTLEDLPDVIAELIAGSARLERGREAEAAHSRAVSELAGIAEQIGQAQRELAELEQRRAALPTRLRECDDELEIVRQAAAGAAAASEHVRAVRERLGAARRAQTLAAAYRQAESEHLAAGERAQFAQAAVTALLRRRLLGIAGELAAELVPGQACVVCGSTEHPAPAEAHPDAVDDRAIEAAERARDAATVEVVAAAEAARTARDSLAAATAAAGGTSADALRSELDHAERELRDAEGAVTRRDVMIAQRAELEAVIADVDAAHSTLLSAIAAWQERQRSLRSLADDEDLIAREARGTFDTVAAHLVHLATFRDSAEALERALRAAREAEDHESAADADVLAQLAASPFVDELEARSALRDPAAVAAADSLVREHEVAMRVAREQLRELELRLAGEPDEPVDLAAAATALGQARDAWSAAVDAAARAEQVADSLAALAVQAHTLTAASLEAEEAHAALARLADTVAGRAPNTHRMTLEAFVLAAELEEIVAAANLRLSDMSSGRYTLQHTDARAARGVASGLGLEVMDAFTGQSRPAQSLSGGETFLASLALALGLAEVVSSRAGGIRLDTLFVDEGFGSLDDETLDIAMRTLDELRQGGRTVGLISHVAAMKEQIPAQLLVTATPAGPSVIRIGTRT